VTTSTIVRSLHDVISPVADGPVPSDLAAGRDEVGVLEDTEPHLEGKGEKARIGASRWRLGLRGRETTSFEYRLACESLEPRVARFAQAEMAVFQSREHTKAIQDEFSGFYVPVVDVADQGQFKPSRNNMRR